MFSSANSIFTPDAGLIRSGESCWIMDLSLWWLPPQPYSGIYYLWSFFLTWCHTSFWMTNQVIKLTLAQFAYDLFLLSSLDSGRFSVQQVAHNAVASKFVTTDSPLISLSGLFFHFMVRFSSSTDSFHVDKLIPGLHYHFSSRDYLQSVSLTACV